MQNVVSKLILALFIAWITLSPYYFGSVKGEIPRLIISNWVTFWDIITGDKEKQVKAWDILFVTVYQDWEYLFTDLNQWVIMTWAVAVSSYFDYTLLFWDKSFIHLNDSWVSIKRLDDNIYKIYALHGTSEVKIKWQIVRISNWYWITVDTSKNYSNDDYFSLLVNLGYKKMSIIWKQAVFNPEVWKFAFSQTLGWADKVVVFSNKQEENDKLIQVGNFNLCADIMQQLDSSDWYLNDKKNWYRDFSSKCINPDLIKYPFIESKLLGNIYSLKSLTFRFDALELINNLRGKKVELVDKLSFLNLSIERVDLNFLKLIVASISKDVQKEAKLINLMMAYNDLDAILINNPSMANKDLLHLRWQMEDRILDLGKDNLTYLSNVLMKMHFDFAKMLVNAERLDLVDFILEKRVFFGLDYDNSIVAYIYDKYKSEYEVFSKAVKISKQTLHSSSEEQGAIWDESFKIAQKQIVMERGLNDFIKSFSKMDKRSVNEFNFDDLVDAFSKYGYKLTIDNITPHIRNWSTFTMTWVTHAWIMVWWVKIPMSMDYSYVNDTVYNINIGTGSFVAAIPLKNLRTIANDLINWKKPENYINTIVSWISEISDEWINDENQEISLKKALIIEYFATMNIKILVNDISCTGSDLSKYRILKSTMSYIWDNPLKFSFSVDVDTWGVSNVVMLDYPGQNIFEAERVAKNLPWVIKKTYDIIVKRNENIDSLLKKFNRFELTKDSLAIDDLQTDWFKVHQDLQLKAWAWSLNPWIWQIDWTYNVWNNSFTSVFYQVGNESKSWENISFEEFMKLVNEVENKMKLKDDEEKNILQQVESRFVDYSSSPQELIKGDWISD